jgi:uncharacterized repeat protein (TIGR01451 family)
MNAKKQFFSMVVSAILLLLAGSGHPAAYGALDPGATALDEYPISGAETSSAAAAEAIIIDHTSTDITAVPRYWIEEAKRVLHIGYGHTSHGSQITTGMSGLVGFANGGGLGLSLPNDIFQYSQNGNYGGTHLHLFQGDGYGSGDLDHDAGYYPNWVDETRAYLGTPVPGTGRGQNHPEINVIMWSWCGQASGKTEQSMIDTYLAPMTQLEGEYPGVTFVYMTGHANGTGEDGNLHKRNQQIRDYCIQNNKVLFDFYDIELYDPDGNYYGDRYATDGCNYDFNNSGSTTETGSPALPTNGDRNWAIDWRDAHTEGVDWYSCGCAHSQNVNCNQKAYAAWWMWARLAGWSGLGESAKVSSVLTATYGQTVTYTVTIQNLVAPVTATVYMTDTVPAGLSYVSGTLTAVGGTGVASQEAAPKLTWSGILSPTSAVTVTYATTVTLATADVIAAPVIIDVPGYQTITRTATIVVNPYQAWLPVALRE